MYQKTSPCSRGVRSYVLSFVLVVFAFHSSFAQNPIVTENALPGNPNSEWDLTFSNNAFGDPSIMGFSTDISVNKGSTIHFKINVSTGADMGFGIKIYRLGYYGGNGARLVADLGTGFTGVTQNACAVDNVTGLTDCGNWVENASWVVPAGAVSGLYIAKLTRSAAGGGGSNHIAFIVRDDASTSALLFKTSDATWQAYNGYGGNSLYVGPGLANNHGAKVSYNRPFITRDGTGGGGVMEDWLFNSEYPMIRFLERNGYDMSYITDVDVVRSPGLLTNHKVFMSVGHDEYWSKEERDNVEAARAAGEHLAFFSGNEVYWKTRWENSIDGNNTPYRTMVCYKEGTLPTVAENACGGKCDPMANTWTGLWRDGCGYPGVADACKPENALTGEISWDGTDGTITVPFAYKNFRFWRNTPSVSNLTSGQTATLAAGTLGYEWDWEQYANSYPNGRNTLSSTLLDGRTHKLSLYKSTSGGWVFGAGTVQWAWGLDANHDRNVTPWNQVSVDMQQATINLFADMGVSAGTLQSGLVQTTASTDVTAPVSIITSPSNGAIFPQGDTVTITGTASDVGGQVAGVEISVDGGSTWLVANGTTSWTFTWVPATQGNFTIKSRGYDDSGNKETPGGSEGSANTVNITISALASHPYTIFNPGQSPDFTNINTGLLNDGQPLTLGVKFKANNDGYISAIRFYKAKNEVAQYTVGLWSTDVNDPQPLQGTATFSSTADTGWVEVPFVNPVQISANKVYIASYFSPNGWYSDTNSGLADSIVNGPLTALADNDPEGDGVNGVYDYSTALFYPTSSYQATNYWVDVKYIPTIGKDTIPPEISSTSPAANATNININSFVTATFNKEIDSTTILNSTFKLVDASNNPVPVSINAPKNTRTITLVPNSPLAYSTTYTATVVGEPVDPHIQDTSGNSLKASYSWSFTTAPPPAAPPDAGSGGPVLIISSISNPFSRYPAEILQAEGYNAFEAKDITEVNAAVLDSFDIVILGQVQPAEYLTVQAMLTTWVNAGGTLIALRPDATNTSLMSLFGVTATGSNLSDAYLAVDTTTGKPGAGIVGQTIQYHGMADLYTLSGATSLASLYSSASTKTSNPAVTTMNVGTNGGKAIAFAYDLAKSVVYTRQGNPAWAGQDRDNEPGPIRSDNLFFPNWIDFNKVAIPQADEQQHLLSNIMLLSNLHRKPLPHLWFLPSGFKAAVIMTGDDHDIVGLNPVNTGTQGRFDEYIQMSGTNNDPQSVADWKAIRGTSYIINDTPVPDDSVAYYQNLGFEIALHPTTGCTNFTAPSLYNTLSTSLSFLETQLPSLTPPVTNRTHCMPWSDWASHPKIESTLGIRFDVNYYYWPGTWIQNRPGMFTGSGMPMRFADLDGSIIDCYQGPTVITDESGQDIPLNINTLLDNATGAPGYYGAFVVNMHTDTAIHSGSDAIIAAAQARNVPVISARQMLTWLDSRNATAFSGPSGTPNSPITWTANANGDSLLSFNITTTAHNLQAMVPFNSASSTLSKITENGSTKPFTVQTIKGISYGVFSASASSYVAIYSSTPLPVTLINFTATKENSTDALLKWTTTFEQNNKGFEVQRSTDATNWTVLGFVSGMGNSQISTNYQYVDHDLASGTYYYRLRQVDFDEKFQYSPVVQLNFDGGLSLELLPNRPNPFSNSTVIGMVIPKAGRVQLTLYDQMGRQVQQIMDEVKMPGTYQVTVNRNALGSGIYYYKLNALNQTLVRKMTIL
ncbi:MAG: DUF4082 domain-containing protein [Bacteroidota bacterium]|nr:DUF4082 domain-containing protein [Bacteroidota bacterium]